MVDGSDHGFSLKSVGSVPAMAVQLRSCEENAGIDFDACVSISCLWSNFLYLDTPSSAIASISPPSGINGGTSEVGGIGPMLVRSKADEYILDPRGVYLVPNDNQPRFRVLAIQKLKALGVRVVGFHKGATGVLMDQNNGHLIELTEEGPPNKKVLAMETQPALLCQYLKVSNNW